MHLAIGQNDELQVLEFLLLNVKENFVIIKISYSLYILYTAHIDLNPITHLLN